MPSYLQNILSTGTAQVHQLLLLLSGCSAKFSCGDLHSRLFISMQSHISVTDWYLLPPRTVLCMDERYQKYKEKITLFICSLSVASSNPLPEPDFHLTQYLPSCMSLLRINAYIAWDDFASAKKCHGLIGQERSINVMFHLPQLSTPVSNLLHNSSSITHHNSSPWEVNGVGSIKT